MNDPRDTYDEAVEVEQDRDCIHGLSEALCAGFNHYPSDDDSGSW